MKTYRNLYPKLCSYDNLKLAWRKARKRKTLKDYVMEFESDLENNLQNLRYGLQSFTYAPRPMKNFIVRDPKTRKISASHFRDRIVHHAICNIIAPIFERQFIHDSYANQINKGTHSAIKRAEKFMRKVSSLSNKSLSGRDGQLFLKKKPRLGYALKADIRHYFDTVDHEILLNIIERKIKDKDVIWLIKMIVNNHYSTTECKGMPLGNVTSQFFANVYLHNLDIFVKHVLKAKYYIRYVDDFIIYHKDRKLLENWKMQINNFLKCNLKIELHPHKSRIIQLGRGITILGYRIFYNYRLLKKSNTRRIWKRLEIFKQRYSKCKMRKDDIARSLSGWIAYAKFANTYKLRQRVTKRCHELFVEDKAHAKSMFDSL